MDQATFQLGVTLPVGKALTESEDGDLIIEGIAADYSEDRQGETYVGAFDEAIKAYLDSGGPLLYHHKRDRQLGQVTALSQTDQGLAIKAVIPKPSDPELLDVYTKVKRGMMRGLSFVGGVLKRQGANTIQYAIKDLQEISITPQPVGPSALLAVAQKAFDDEITDAQAAELREWFDARYDRLMLRLDEGYVQKAAPTAEQRKKYGMSDGSFPVWHCGSGPGSVKSAMSLRGKGNQPADKVLAHIQSAARRLGCPEQAKTGD